MAQVQANGFSFSMGRAGTSTALAAYFTTFDGLTSLPLQDCADGWCTISQEISPVVPGSTSYQADYLAVDADGMFEYGGLFVTLEASDADGDGMLDPLERSRLGNFTFGGRTRADWNAYGVYVVSDFSVSVLRSAGSTLGTYSGSFSNSTQSANISGNFGLSGAAGAVSYDLGGSTLAWNLTHRGLDGVLRGFSGTSQIDRIGTDWILIPPFALSDSSSGLSLQTEAVTMQRAGNTFRGTIRVRDGELKTSWPDYTTFRMELVDGNDTDFDGLPDIVSLPEPATTAQVLAVSLTLALVRRRRRHSWRVDRKPGEGRLAERVRTP